MATLAAACLVSQLSLSPERAPQAANKLPRQQLPALESLRAYLGLSDAQDRQLQDLNRLNRTETRATSEKIRSLQATVHAMVNSVAHADGAQLDRLVEELSSLRARLGTAHQELARKALAVLTADQQAKLALLSSTVQAQRQASPQAMPESWPLIYAASQLGLMAPPARGESFGEGNGNTASSPLGTVAASLN